VPFTNAAWSKPAGELDASEYCSVCLIDMNAKGAEKIKAKCKLPVRARPGAPYNKNALRNAAARLPQTDAPASEKRKAARKLVRLMREDDMTPGRMTLQLAGMR